MRAQRGMRRVSAQPQLQIGPEIYDRAELTNAADEATIRCFVMTRGAEQAWTAINQQLAEPHGAAFWIAGPTGVGKTHFLNYIGALSSRAARISDDTGRDLTIRFPVSAEKDELERAIAALIARELGAEGRAGALWRQLDGKDAIRVALDQAKRQGVRTLNLLIDFGDSEADANMSPLRALPELAQSLKSPRFNVIAAGGGAPDVAMTRNILVSAARDAKTRAEVGR